MYIHVYLLFMYMYYVCMYVHTYIVCLHTYAHETYTNKKTIVIHCKRDQQQTAKELYRYEKRPDTYAYISYIHTQHICTCTHVCIRTYMHIHAHDTCTNEKKPAIHCKRDQQMTAKEMYTYEKRPDIYAFITYIHTQHICLCTHVCIRTYLHIHVYILSLYV